MDPANCIHANTTPAYSVSGAAATLIVETCDNCGEKVNSTIVPNDS